MMNALDDALSKLDDVQFCDNTAAEATAAKVEVREIIYRLEGSLHTEIAQLRAAVGRLEGERQALREAVILAESALRETSKYPTENGWIECAPQWLQKQADALAAALAADEREVGSVGQDIRRTGAV
jgi:hypothetical protein